jgi:hypothetical protein
MSGLSRVLSGEARRSGGGNLVDTGKEEREKAEDSCGLGLLSIPGRVLSSGV